MLLAESPFNNIETQSSMCTDGDYLYLYSSKSGLSKYSLNDKDSKGQLIIANTEFQAASQNKIKNGSLFMINNHLYFRCKGVYMYNIDKKTL